MTNTNWMRWMGIAAVALSAAACGGGGGGSPAADNGGDMGGGGDTGAADFLASLQGDWFSPCVDNGDGTSVRTLFSFDGNRTTNNINVRTDSNDCSTAPDSTASRFEQATLVIGSEVTTAGGLTARTVDVTFDGGGENSLLLTIARVDQNGTRLLVGDSDSPRDAAGRDTGLDFDRPFTRGTPPVSGPAPNNPPTLQSGSDFQMPEEGETVVLNVVARDNDGAVVSVLWEQVAGSQTVALSSVDMEMTSFTAPQVDGSEEYRFSFTATDDQGASSFLVLTVTVVDAAGSMTSPECSNDPDGGADCATVLTLVDGRASASDNLSAGDVDVYRFTLDAPDTAFIETTGSTDTLCLLSDENLNPVQDDDDSGDGTNCRFDAVDLQAGTYFVSVRGFDEAAIGDYSLDVIVGPVNAPAGPTPPPQPAAYPEPLCGFGDDDGDFECANDLGFIQGGVESVDSINPSAGDSYDFYSFSVDMIQGTTFTAQLTDRSGGTLLPFCQLFNSNMVLLESGCDQSGGGLQNGRYFFSVRAGNVEASGDYRLFLNFN